MKAVLAIISTGEKIKEVNTFPRDLNLPDYAKINNEIDSDQRWYLVVQEEKPLFDIITQKLIPYEEPTNIPHPDYPDLFVWKKFYAIEQKTKEELIAYVSKLQSDNDELLGKSELLNKLMIFSLGALCHIEQGGVKTAKMSTVLNLMKEKALKIWQNDDTAQSKIAAITADENVDLTTEWINE